MTENKKIEYDRILSYAADLEKTLLLISPLIRLLKERSDIAKMILNERDTQSETYKHYKYTFALYNEQISKMLSIHCKI